MQNKKYHHSCVGECLLKNATLIHLTFLTPSKREQKIIQLISLYKTRQVVDFIATILILPNHKRDFESLKDEIFINIDHSDFDLDLKKSRNNFATQHKYFLSNEIENLYYLVNSLSIGEDDDYITKIIMELVQYHALTLDKTEKQHFKNIVKNMNFGFFGITKKEYQQIEIQQ